MQNADRTSFRDNQSYKYSKHMSVHLPRMQAMSFTTCLIAPYASTDDNE